MATTVIGAHGLEHLYANSFQVFLPAIYDSLGLVPVQGALLMATRRLSGGLVSMGSGFFVDMFQHRVGLVLAFSMGLIGVGYLLVAVSPSYALILAALAVASAGSALWHPPALGSSGPELSGVDGGAAGPRRQALARRPLGLPLRLRPRRLAQHSFTVYLGPQRSDDLPHGEHPFRVRRPPT